MAVKKTITHKDEIYFLDTTEVSFHLSKKYITKPYCDITVRTIEPMDGQEDLAVKLLDLIFGEEVKPDKTGKPKRTKNERHKNKT